MSLSSVVIHYFYVLSACVGPAETDTPLIIDTNAVLTFSVADQRFKAIARGHPQIVQSARDMPRPRFHARRIYWRQNPGVNTTSKVNNSSRPSNIAMVHTQVWKSFSDA